MIPPPTYPRMPYLLAAPSTSRDDRVLPPAGRAGWWHVPLLVEEKLDGANVVLWNDGSQVRVASRGGPDAMDRGGQLGRLRAWVYERAQQLQPLLADGRAVYGEWLWLRHGVGYDRLPDWLVVLDLWHAGAMLPTDDRDERCAQAALTVPPSILRGRLSGEAELRTMLGRSAFASDEPAEGLVLRRPDGARAKVVSPEFRPATDEGFALGRRNGLSSLPGAAPAPGAAALGSTTG